MPPSKRSAELDEPERIQFVRESSPIHRVRHSQTIQQEIISPQKKARVAKLNNRPQAPRTKHNHKPLAYSRHDSSSPAASDTMDLDIMLPESSSQLQEQPPGVKISDTLGYTFFLASLEWDDDMFTIISNELFVVHGWNYKKNEATSHRYHLSRTFAGPNISVVCLCPSWEIGSPCYHEVFLQSYGTVYFPIDLKPGIENKATLIYRVEGTIDNTFESVFSVPKPGAQFDLIRTRAIVEHIGINTGEGVWKCSKDNAIGCQHIKEARICLQTVVHMDMHAKDLMPISGALQYPDIQGTPTRANRASPPSVSFMPLPPPVWARIPDDPVVPALPLFSGPIETIRLDSASSCSCRGKLSVFNTENAIILRPCIIYMLTHAFESLIETQKCPNCIHRRIGPDCRNIGLFNCNNRILFSHSLLDDYTACFTASETPFAAWITGINRRYLTHQSPREFVREKTFLGVWFSYIKLVRLDDDMKCSKCGPSPEVTIWDGVTLAFNKRHLLNSLRPPTYVDSTSQLKPNVKPAPGAQCIIEKSLRKDINEIVHGPGLIIPSLESLSLDTTNVTTTDDDTKRNERQLRTHQQLVDRLELVPGTVIALRQLNTSLGELFERYFGWEAIASKRHVPSIYKKLFLQIAAEENVLQFINETALISLSQFIKAPNSETASSLVLIPALYHVIKQELKTSITHEVAGLCLWLYQRAWSVLAAMKHYGHPSKENIDPTTILSWEHTGACYGMPTVRQRPHYPSFPNDSGKDNSKLEQRGEGCNKFYAKYGESRLTGGIMCVWCTHSICYGFHCIPSAEGRNDVFSAIYTKWEKAPSVVVYDFACALQPYCMTREPEFFAKTLFVVDSFHSMGHTKCGKAAFLDAYCETNPLLLSVNSSAAESGNGGIGRIRKSVSYMSQARAIVYTKVFISIWNRERIRDATGYK